MVKNRDGSVNFSLKEIAAIVGSLALESLLPLPHHLVEKADNSQLRAIIDGKEIQIY